jgi:hypothetical protein
MRRTRGPEPRRPLGVRPPRLVALDADHERQAVEALATLLRSLLASGDGSLKGTVEGTCDEPVQHPTRQEPEP